MEVVASGKASVNEQRADGFGRERMRSERMGREGMGGREGVRGWRQRAHACSERPSTWCESAYVYVGGLEAAGRKEGRRGGS
eukprot:363192-Chlamydomonas_euryale.AAC.7